MKKPTAFSDDNRANLVAISKLFEDIDHFVFYGTLLGITRGRDLIEGDDDIDILAPNKYRKLIIQKINNIDGFKVNLDIACNKSVYFLHIESSVNNRDFFIDF